MLSGTLRKMRAELGTVNHPDEVNYFLPVGEQELPLNPYIGKHLELEFLGNIICKNCGRKTSKKLFTGVLFPLYEKVSAM